MSIEGKHSYRFVYLKSEKWKAVRLEALVRESGKCQICFEESVSNDAHHVWYPESIWDTTKDHLVVLCRPCHDFIHSMLPECKTNNEETGRSEWLRFSNAILAWRREKVALFMDPTGIAFKSPKSLREELARLKLELSSRDVSGNVTSPSPESEYDYAIGVIKKWGQSYKHSAKSVIIPIANTDYEI